VTACEERVEVERPIRADQERVKAREQGGDMERVSTFG
jgi:hypothetical protein